MDSARAGLRLSGAAEPRRVWYDRFDRAVRSDEWIRMAADYLDGALPSFA
jgi:hypothetical protein